MSASACRINYEPKVLIVAFFNTAFRVICTAFIWPVDSMGILGTGLKL